MLRDLSFLRFQLSTSGWQGRRFRFDVRLRLCLFDWLRILSTCYILMISDLRKLSHINQ